ncbi:MAG: TolC family protein [Terracidiphilus sp.]|nr:TolC family protein [Terracidiphilus sp.]
MKSVISLLFLSLAVIIQAQAPPASPLFAAPAALLAQHEHHLTASAPALTLDEAERIALAANPEIALAARRVAMAQAHVPSAGALDDPMAMTRFWGVPLQKPWDLNAAQSMFSLSQTLPGPGKRALRTGIANSDVAVAQAQLDQVRLQVRIAVRKAFYDLLRAQDEERIHDEHVSVAQQAIEAARIKYTVGKVPQQDVLKAQVALTRLAEHMIRFTQDIDMARSQLNTLLGRDPATPVSASGAHRVLSTLPDAKALAEAAFRTRPDLLAAAEAAEKSRREQALAKKAYTPDFTVSAGYMLMPTGTDMRNAYMVEGSMNLPWLNRHRHDAEIAEASAQTTMQEAELASMQNAALGQIREALVNARAAQSLARMYHNDLRPQAEATLEASVVAYENDKTDFLDLLDSQMSLVDIDLAWIQAVGDFDSRLADLELSIGAPLEDAAPASQSTGSNALTQPQKTGAPGLSLLETGENTNSSRPNLASAQLLGAPFFAQLDRAKGGKASPCSSQLQLNIGSTNMGASGLDFQTGESTSAPEARQ